ncbi:50S ribosomal protein L9 [Temperatibacter marinus]|uniref:Large ribosomal subunit protein bL9 n=1 Tax=Temperatibacter marinus TaxID=1456591 RepID=A0AA52ECV4_9PROT|nr:50S ribosomal protein L9 [Temperatibacter marinus]WND02355.1 50S ribosomal protein L9 [Temperatibacter marinus]
MQVILLERVEKLGQMGDEVSVKNGYARNFLLPQGKALRATETNKKFFETQKAQLEADNLKRKEEAEAVAAKAEGAKVIMIRAAGESGQLYGSVTSRDIAEALADAGITISRSQVSLDRAIKTIGLHEIKIVLHPEVAITVTVNIARSSEEADVQFETGGAVVKEDDFESDFESSFGDEDEDEAAEDASDEEASEEEAEEEAEEAKE